MSYRISHDAHESLLNNLDQKIRDTLEVESGDRSLEVEQVHLPEFKESGDVKREKAAKIQGVSFSDPVKATLVLRENNEVIDRSKIKIMDLPNVTKRGTYIVDGNEYSFPLQKRYLPGVYTEDKGDGKIVSWINSGKGMNMKVVLRKKGDLLLRVGTSGANLFAFLVGMGISKSRLRKAWGKDVYNDNKNARGADKPLKALKKFYKKARYKSDPEVEEETIPHLRKWINNYFDEKSELDEENVEFNIGEKHETISPEFLLQVSKNVLAVARGDEEEHNRESLIHSQFMDVSDFVIERMNEPQYRYKTRRTLERNLGKYDKVSKIYRKNLLQKPVQSTFTQTSLAKIPKQTNPMDMMASFNEVTIMGEGGVGDIHAIKNETRALDPSHFGFLDLAHTPEGMNIGTTMHLAHGAKKKGKNIVNKFIDVKTGKPAELNPREVHTSYVTFAENYEDGNIQTNDNGKVKALYKGEIKKVKPNKVQYAIPTSTDMFDTNTMGIPFLGHNNGVRVMTGSKMAAQAKPLKHRESPLVQCAENENSDTTVEETVGKNFVDKSPVDGKVKEVKKDEIIIDGDDGEEHSVSFANNFWLNENNYVDAEPVVEKGDKVKEGDQLTETNYTKDGELALGKNLNTAYTAYKGYNHEDGTVISEQAAEKLTSLHSYQKTCQVQDEDVLDKSKYKSYFPATFDQKQLKKVSKDGVVKEGEEVKKGDPLVLKMREIKEDAVSKKLQNISRLLKQDYKDNSLIWEKGVPGVVEEVHHRKDDIMVVVKTEEKAKVGDKLVGRYGNKATITTILPNDEMPDDEDGETQDILLNPDTVPGRMNIGQVLETTASKIAEEEGEKYIADPFGEDSAKKIEKELEEKGLKDHGKLLDQDGEIDGVLTGKQYFYKLEHQVEKKLSSRGAGPEYSYTLDGHPARGEGESGRSMGLAEMYALLSHGANTNLKEMYTFKGDKQYEIWRAIENGTFVPSPDMPRSSQKFVEMLRGMGVDMQEKSGQVQMTPFLDRDVEEVSNGEIEDATALRAKDLKEEDGGLFDLETTGGVVGTKWSHIELAEPMPHPTFEKSILAVTGLRKKDFKAVVNGDKGVVGGEVVDADKPGAVTGGEGVKKLLGDIDVEKRLEEIEEEAPDKRGTALNKLHREGRVLKNFQDNGIELDEMVVDKVPVIPPQFRQIVELPNGDLSVGDVNEHYRSMILMNNQLKEFKDKPGLKEEADDVRGDLYTGFKGTMGFGSGLVSKPDIKGLADTVAGTKPKRGYFQSKTLKRRQETSGTAVIGPDPELGMDQIGIPDDMAWDIFRPYTVKELKSRGLSSMKSREEIEERSDMAKDALQSVMKDRMVMANRAPTLHKFSIMAFKPKLTSGHQVTLPVEVLGGFNADFDGDCSWGKVHIIDNKGTKRIDLEDFPRKEETKEEAKDHVDVYEVPEDVKIYAYDRDKNCVRPFNVTQYSVHRDLEMAEVTYKSGRTVEVSSDHSLFCITEDGLELEDVKPFEAEGLRTPRPKLLNLPESKDFWSLESPGAGKDVLENMPLNSDSGYFWGAMVGDGYATNKGRSEFGHHIGFCNSKDNIIDKVQDFVTSVGGAECTIHENPHEFDGSDCYSQKAHWSFGNLGYNIQKFIGSGSANKKLPSFWVYGDKGFRLGLFAGLLDTDGKISEVNSKGKKPQIQIAYYTKSEHLADDLVLLCASLGIRSRITDYEKESGTHKVVSISTPDFQEIANDLPVLHEDKKEVLETLGGADVQKRQDDLLTIPKDLADKLKSNLKSTVSKQEKSMRQVLYNASKKGYINRETLKRYREHELWNKVTSDLEGFEDIYDRFIEIAEAENVIWDEVVDVEKIPGKHEAYDITVPDSLVFMMSNTVIVYDTMGIHVPSSKEAVEEAKGMMPSKNLYVPGSRREKLAPGLQKEYIVGIHKLTKVNRKKKEKFDSPEKLMKAAEDDDHEVDWTDEVKVSGIGKTTAGRCAINQYIPENLREYDTSFDSDKVHEKLKEIHKKEGREEFMTAIEGFKHEGRNHVYKTGTSFLLSDLRSLEGAKDKIYSKADKKVEKVKKKKGLSEEEKKEKIIDIYGEADEKISKMSLDLPDNAAGKPNNMKTMVDAGMSKPGPSQMKQLVGSIGLMVDHRNEVIEDPVKGNYTEGLTSADFYAHMFSRRKSLVDKSRSVSGPGMLAKELTNTAARYKITEQDCGTNNGRKEKIDRNVIDRVLQESVEGFSKGTVVDNDVFEKLNNSNRDKVKVRSILECESTNGMCAKCYGYDEDGGFPEVGKNIGVSEIQAITERSVQLPMKAHHCIKRGATVTVKTPDSKILKPTHEELYYMIERAPHMGDDWEEKYVTNNWEIWDKSGWTKLKKVGRHKKNSPMIGIKTKSGDILVCQSNHPMTFSESPPISCEECGSIDLGVCGQREWGYYIKCRNCENRQRGNKDDWHKSKVKIKEAGDIEDGDIVGISSGPSITKEGYNGIMPPYMLGMFLAEGSFIIRNEDGPKYNKEISHGNVKRGGRNLVGCTITQSTKGEIRNRISKYIDGLEYSTNVDRKNMVVHSKEFSHNLFNEVRHTSHEKSAPSDFITNATKDQMASLICGIIDGDGHVSKPKDQNSSYIGITTASFGMVSQILEICDELEIWANPYMATIRENQNYQVYTIRIYPTKQQASKWFSESVKVNANDFTKRKSKYRDVEFSEVSYIKETLQEEDEWVYDVTTETGTFCSSRIWTHNTGGVASEAGLDSAFDRALEIFRMPNNVKNKATLAERTGRVTNIRDSGYGGHVITVAGKQHKTPQGRELKVKVGDRVKEGDPLTDGSVKSQELMEHKGVDAVQDQMTNDLQETFESAGVKADKKTFEMSVKMYTEKVRITDPGGNDEYVPGDYSTLPKVKAWNRENPHKKSIEYTNVLPGSMMSPHKGDDWAQRMTLGRIKKTLQEGAGMGFKSERGGIEQDAPPFADISLGPDTEFKGPGE